ncbi:MAG: YceI family protein [Acidobacteriota bacterium]
MKNSQPQLMRCSRALVASAASFVALLALPLAAPLGAEELVIFTQKTDSDISKTFHAEHLPDLLKQAFELDLVAKVIDISERGAPDDIHLTPLVLYQSHRGRAIFQGRYVDTGKVLHFIRTQRAIPPTAGDLEVSDGAVADLGRARILAPLKITPLGGQVPEGYDAEAFQEKARDAIMEGFERFSRRARATLGASDRSFYMDFHPYRSEDGGFFVSTALFSQFNCIEPVFIRFEAPTGGAWADFPDVFARAARELEEQVFATLTDPKLGDGFDAVPDSTPATSWADLGLPLPERVAGAAAADVHVELPTRWRLAPGDNLGPRLLFRFPPPLERYSGEVGDISGQLLLRTKDDLNGASGFIVARTGSVTMGEDALDEAILTKMIFASRFPEARFDLESASTEEALAFGRISRLVAQGTFTMMGIDIPLEVRAQLEPVIGEDGDPRLQVQAGFEMRLKSPFGIEGPHGPAPANDTLDFHLNVLLEPDPESAD